MDSLKPLLDHWNQSLVLDTAHLSIIVIEITTKHNSNCQIKTQNYIKQTKSQ